MKSTAPTNTDEYIASFPPATQKLLQELRATIKKAAPAATETISYQMPAYDLNGKLVYFAAYQQHIGFYPMPSAIMAFKEELSAWKGSKGAVQFPLDKPIPKTLISKIVKFRLKENLEKAALKKKKK